MNETLAFVTLNLNAFLFPLSFSSSGRGNLQRLDYAVGLTPQSDWEAMGAMQEPAVSDLNGAFETTLNDPNTTVYPAEQVNTVPNRLLKTAIGTATPVSGRSTLIATYTIKGCLPFIVISVLHFSTGCLPPL